MTSASPDPRWDALRANAIAELTAWTPPDAQQGSMRTAYLDLLRNEPLAVAKAGPPRHLTASVLVLSPDLTDVLLTHHRKARQWFQFGGHLELGDLDLRAAAAREALEESGLETALAPQIAQLDQHVLAGDFTHCREHWDVRYAAVADRQASPGVSAESLDVAWWSLAALPPRSDQQIARLANASIRVITAARAAGWPA